MQTETMPIVLYCEGLLCDTDSRLIQLITSS